MMETSGAVPQRTWQGWTRRSLPALLVLAAIVVRFVVFTARGDYVAFDEGWYLLLGRNLFEGEGFSLTGLRHTTLSPLFPILAGFTDFLIDDSVRAGRIVAAVSAGLLVWPCWFIFRRLAGEGAALTGAVLIIFMPSLTPFAAPYWIGWDLWVGAEPLMHLCLFSAIALTLRALETEHAADWVAAGVLFALAYLARPEAVIVFALVGAAAGSLVLWKRNARQVARALLMALAFAATAAPYWIYLHDALGRWTLTGRFVELPAQTENSAQPGSGPRDSSAPSGIERMLWQNDNRQYVRELYGLDASGTRLRSTYWGIPVEEAAPRPAADYPITNPAPDSASGQAPQDPSSRWALYARSLGIIVPWFIWPLAIIGLAGRRGRLMEEAIFALPLVATSLAIARIVGADPRTQLLILPLVIYFAARGICLLGDMVERRVVSPQMRPGFVSGILALLTVIGLGAIVGNWVWAGHAVGSPHHVVGAANRAAGAELARIVSEGEPVMSWHPAVALYADRPWRVLPYAPLPAIVRYAHATGTRHIVLSRFFPGSRSMESLETDHFILRAPAGGTPSSGTWSIDIVERSPAHVLGQLRYPDSSTAQ